PLPSQTTSPVSLNCQHTFCKSCIQQRVEQSSDHGEWRPGTTAGQDMCSKHNEILQLFCDTDKRLICVVCRDGRAHAGHKFKPVKEAQDDIMEKLVSDLIYLQEDINMVVKFLESERGITANTRERNIRLKAKISSQFEELREQLRLREEQAMREIEDMDMDFETKLTEIEELLQQKNTRLLFEDSAQQQNTFIMTTGLIHSPKKVNNVLRFSNLALICHPEGPRDKM
uniref:B box-type domain-containing protein n=1 Tax=Hucho hucho TaxID=62062 RepID=A0A4W5Q5Q8_9TELE